MQHSITIEGRAFRLGCLAVGSRAMYRFPLEQGQGLYALLQDFDQMVSLHPKPSKHDETKTVTCASFGGNQEAIFDCTPDQLVAIIKLYRDVDVVQKTLSGIFGR